ncbi:unnamed protein product, partial [Coregonus sp. 'balchen']
MHHAPVQTEGVGVSEPKEGVDAALGVSGGHSHSHQHLHAYIGVSLVLGFVFMLLVDQIGSAHVHSSADESARVASSKITTTLGLVVHAAADGVALGAAASTSQTSVQLIVFVAIMLHKAPAAFGLVSFLMHAGLERNRIRKHLLVFALAAPVLAMVTFVGLSQVTDGVALGAAASTSQTSVQLIVFVAIMLHKAPAAFGLVSFLMHAGLERNRIRKHLLVFALAAPVLAMVTFVGLSQALSDVNATGVAMLFSAGTFLYVATVHVLPEVGGTGHSHAPAPGKEAAKGLSKVEVGTLLLGCLIPLVLSVGHQH